MLETTECIPINNYGKEYTDCMEFSLLRFLQILYYDPIQLNETNKLSNYLTENSQFPKLNKTLLQFIRKYPMIYQSADYYLSDDSPGIIERQDWAIFTSNQPHCFQYYRNDQAEVMTNLSNIFSFLFYFVNLPVQMISQDFSSLKFMKLQYESFLKSKHGSSSSETSLELKTEESEEEEEDLSDAEEQLATTDKLKEEEEKDTQVIAGLAEGAAKYDEMMKIIEKNFQIMSETFSLPTKRFHFHISFHDVLIKEKSMDFVCQYLSRPDKEYKRLSTTYEDVVFSSMVIDIQINEELVYQWHLREVYFRKEELVKNRLITGHSVIELVAL